MAARLPARCRSIRTRHRAAEVGDEPLLLARLAPTIVARDRVAGARLRATAGAGVIVMDDGFQNPSLDEDLSIVVVDGQRGIGNGRVFPAGPLRAPLAPQLDRAQAVLVVGGGEARRRRARGGRRGGACRCSTAAANPIRMRWRSCAARPVLAFAGIGDPDKFFGTLAEAGVDLRVRRPFADHHRYRRAEAADLLAEAEREGLTLVTTEKDWVRLAGEPDLSALAAVARPLPVTLRWPRRRRSAPWCCRRWIRFRPFGRRQAPGTVGVLGVSGFSWPNSRCRTASGVA